MSPINSQDQSVRPAVPADSMRHPGSSSDIFELLGCSVEVVAPPGEAQSAIRTLFRGFGPVASPAGDLVHFELVPVTGGWQLLADAEVVSTDESLTAAIGRLEWRVVSDALDRRADLFQVHGSAVCLPLQRAGLILVASSGRGKTTLTMGLMLRGFVPFADDVVLVDPGTLELRALRRAFHVDDALWPLLESASGPIVRDESDPVGYFSPPQWAEQPVPVRWVLFPEYRPHQTPEFIPLSPSEAAKVMLEQTMSLVRAPRLSLATAARLTSEARCYRFLSGDLSASLAMIQRLTATPVISSKR